MSLPTVLALFTTVLFGVIAVVLSIKEEKLRHQAQKSEESRKRRLYELSVLRSIQERIGYSLDVEHVIDTLTGSLKNLFPYSTVSSLVLSDDKTVFKITLEERVGTNFITQVKKSMLASLSGLLDHPLPGHSEEFRTGVIVDETNTKPLASFFHIPLIVNGQVVGIISICSTKPGLYKDADMTILYQMTATASNALSKLKEVISTEQDKLLAMITSLADGIIMIDNSYQMTLLNQAAKELLGIQHLPHPTIFDTVNMLSKQYDFGAKIKEALSQNKPFEDKNLQLGDKTVSVLISPVLGPIENYDNPTQRSVIGATVLLHDITLEKSLQLLKEDFTNAVVHELRSPLTAIKAASEVMIDTPELPQSAKKLSSIIDQQSKRMLNDINSLLDAAKLEAGHFTVWQAPARIQDVIEDSIELFSPEAERKHIQISVSVEEKLPQAFIDSTRIEQVVNNVVSNSLKFTPENGHISIKATSQYNPQLPITPTNPGILVSVTDDGIGIPEEKQKILFNKFRQIQTQGHEKELSEGTGLGLFIAKGIVEAHKGNMYLTSTPGKGTTMFFTLPIATQETKPLLNPKLQEVLQQYTPKMLN